MQMTGYELLANYEKAEDKDKQIQILADLNHIPVDMVSFVIDNSEKFDTSETPLSTEEFYASPLVCVSNLIFKYTAGGIKMLRNLLAITS